MPELHGKEYFDYYKNQRGFDATAKGQWQANYAAMLERVFHLKGKTVLDVGAACGAQSSAMMDAGFDVHAIEPDEYFVQVSPFENLRGRLLCAPAQKIPCEYAMFDFIHCSQVLEHIPAEDCPRVLEEMFRVARCGALLYASLQIEKAGCSPAPDDDVTHRNYQAFSWWECELDLAGWVLTEEFDAALNREPMQQEYKWNYFVCRRR